MVTKLIAIFTVAGVVAAGSVAYAMNAQSLRTSQTSKVGTETMDFPNRHVIITPDKNAGHNQTKPSSGDAVVVVPAPNSTFNSGGQGAAPSGIGKQDVVPNSDPTPVATPTATDGPVLPPSPPGFKPGQGDDDSGDDDGDEDYEDEDSSDDHGSWEHGDD